MFIGLNKGYRTPAILVITS